MKRIMQESATKKWKCTNATYYARAGQKCPDSHAESGMCL